LAGVNPGSIPIPVYYDFASTLCYVAHRVMERMAPALDALALELRWSPVDLTGITGWRRNDPVEGARRENALRVARELAVAVRMPTRWLDSRRPMAIGLALAGTRLEPAWRERVWSAIYEEGRALDEPGELERVAAEMNVDPALASERRLVELDDRTVIAREAEVTGVPTFMLGAWPLGGIQDEQSMRLILERFAARQRERAEASG
jgi:predicted DsbA family dithiol-disulfide isomerase